MGNPGFVSLIVAAREVCEMMCPKRRFAAQLALCLRVRAFMPGMPTRFTATLWHNGKQSVLVLGKKMNPGPFWYGPKTGFVSSRGKGKNRSGCADWLGIQATIERPVTSILKAPGDGIKLHTIFLSESARPTFVGCSRGARLAEKVFKKQPCGELLPAPFVEASGRNRTPAPMAVVE